jgi:hypothetical protein
VKCSTTQRAPLTALDVFDAKKFKPLPPLFFSNTLGRHHLDPDEHISLKAHQQILNPSIVQFGEDPAAILSGSLGIEKITAFAA